ncbi:MAG: hypothetical protein COB02_02575 [Candidatus Cloacimonadota bacterium]|nr:MAG: hypothetical protein COB02_02575 [Candidatus Cloacimonadota bacterium]
MRKLPSLKVQLVILIFIKIFLVSTQAQKIASFDPYFLLLFHPMMAKFDQSVHRFQKENFKNKMTKKEWHLQRGKLLKELRNQKENIKSKDLQSFYVQLPKLKKDFPLEKDYIREYTKLRLTYLGLHHKNNLEKDFLIFYQNDKKSIRIFSKMWRDIRVAMSKIQKKKKYLFFLPIYKEVNNVSKKPYNLQFIDNKMGISSYLDFTLKSSKIDNEKYIRYRLKDHFKHITKTRDLLYPFMKSKFVLYGLEDVTDLILKEVLKDNHLNKELVLIVSNVYKTWLNKQNQIAKGI